jgi:hypothetical protein
LEELELYDEKVAAGWSMRDSKNIEIVLRNGYAYAGKSAIEATADNGTGVLQFSVRKDAKRTYNRESIVGISFWVSGGEAEITPEDLAVSVLGSNDHSYWVENDNSAFPKGRIIEGEPLFAETRLYALEFNRSIPAETWAEVVVWLDDLPDPAYVFLTGFYIKTDDRLKTPFYVDHITLLVNKNIVSRRE